MSHGNEITYLKVDENDITKHNEHRVYGSIQDRRPTQLNPNPLPGYEIADIVPANGARMITAFVAEEN